MDPDNFEHQLQEWAIYDSSEFKHAPIKQILSPEQLIPLSDNGIFSKVYKIKDQPWVVKEGKWHIDLPVVPGAKVRIPPRVAENIWRSVMMPRPGEVLKQFEEYLLFIRYFGYFGHPDSYYHPQRQQIAQQQHSIRDAIPTVLQQQSHHLSPQQLSQLSQLLQSDLRFHNFVPKEYLLFGRSLNPANRDRETFFIIQEYIPGKTMHDTDWQQILDQSDWRQQMLLLSLLILIFHQQEGRVIDTRPRTPATQIHDWLTSTDNIVFSPERGVRLIDTRWFWDTTKNPVERGLIIPEAILFQSRQATQKILDHELKSAQMP